MYVGHTENIYTKKAVVHVEWKLIITNRHVNPNPINDIKGKRKKQNILTYEGV